MTPYPGAAGAENVFAAGTQNGFASQKGKVFIKEINKKNFPSLSERPGPAQQYCASAFPEPITCQRLAAWQHLARNHEPSSTGRHAGLQQSLLGTAAKQTHPCPGH